MTPPAKKPAKSWLLYLLAIVLVAIGVCAALIIYLTLIRGPEEVQDISDSELLLSGLNSTTSIPVTTTSTVLITSTVAGTTTGKIEDEETSSTEASTTTTTTTEEPSTTTEVEEIAVPLDVSSILKEKTKDFEVVEKCADIDVLPVSCQHQSSSNYQNAAPSQFQPLHYNLNLTLRDVRNTVFEGNAKLFAQTLETTNGIAIHATRIRNLDTNHIRVVNCDSGETLCVTNVRQVDEVVVIETAQKIDAKTNLRLDINGFISSDSTPHLYKQIPTGKWRVPVMIGSVFEPTSARHVFPAFDNHNQKSTFSVCVSHPPQFSVISNSEVLSNQTSTTCFTKTVPLTAQQLSIVAFDETAHLNYNKSSSDGTFLPEFNIVFNLKSNFRSAQYEWIYGEVSKVMNLMSKWSKFSYPLDKLNIVVAPVATGHSALGVMTLPAQAVAYQKHTSTHETLIKEVIGQWMEGIVTTEHTCFEKALVQYLEWKINEELQIVKKTRKLEIAKIRPRNLNETSDQLRVIRSVQQNDKILCSPRFVEVFYTLDETYGENTVVGIIRVIFEKFAFSTATISDWQNAAETATGRSEAGKLIGEWFARPTKRPILQAVVQPQHVEFTQLTDELWSVPLEISGSNGLHLAVIQDKTQSIPFVSTDYVVIDPSRKSHAFVVYDAETYLRLIRCFGDASRCPSKEIGGAFSDLAAALIANILPVPETQDIPKWKSVFKFMAQQNLVEGTAACCVEHAIQEMRKCSYWDIQDFCTKIAFNSVLTRTRLMFQHFSTFLLTVLIFSPGFIEARRSSSGSGGFSSRGQSASRGSVGQTNTGGGFNNNQGGFHQNTNNGGFNNNNVRPNTNQGNFHPNTNQGNFNNGNNFRPNTNTGFHSGSGLGSSSSSGTFKKALIGGALGAAGGIIAYEAGKAIIRSATDPFNYNGRSYHWDNAQVKQGEFQCSMPLSQLTGQSGTTTTTTTTTAAPGDANASSTTVAPTSTTTLSPDQVLQNVQYSNGERPKTIVWGCKVGRETCCGTDCCPVQNQASNTGRSGGGSTIGTVIFIIFLISLLLCCGCCIGAYCCCRQVFDCFQSDNNGRKDDDYQEDYQNQQNYQMQNYAQPQQQQPFQQPNYQQGGYQQPPNQGYPQGGNYYPPAQYPSQPNY
ncbi:unnamed protein product [Caenorhabditis angaria]|uniref:Uncharacterized protein n=1 Tax=Caenorhabditis angaria TaxID=860376 RepID=A0A9P1III2_9PELO|nr:unnamed protein product [Caenorhabditis angaria]